MNSSPRAVAVLRGGLGNQLFQYAAALSIATDHDPAAVRLVSYGNEWGPDHPDLSSLAGLPIEYPDRRMRSTLPGVAVHESWRDAVSQALARTLSHLTRTHLIRQDDPFASRIHPKPGAKIVVLHGFFQNREWWQPTWEVVARMLNEHRPKSLDHLRGEGRTAIKLRRSDYLGRGILLTDDFYRTALDRLAIRDREVFVVCEDSDYLPHFARLLAERGCSLEVPEPITGNPNVDDFWHLAAARVQILANSSYCWWAAAVARVAMDGTRVAYPTPWLPNAWSECPVPDMGLPDWVAAQTEFV